MPWLRFTHDFDFHVGPHVNQTFKAGMEVLVTERCAKQALAAHKAVKIARPADAKPQPPSTKGD